MGLGVVVWKVIDLAKQKAAREKLEAAQATQEERTMRPEQVPNEGFAFDLMLESGEMILETSATSGGVLFRIGQDGKTSRLIYKDYAGNTIGRIEVKRNHEDAAPVN